MSKRDYNVFFNTHTVSGIIISIGLSVIFLAGAFALFMDNINHWEANEPSEHAELTVDYDRLLHHLEAKGYAMPGRTIRMRSHERKIQVFSPPITDPVLHGNQLNLLPDSIAKGGISFHLNPQGFTEAEVESLDNFKRLGGFLYGLHYFHPIPYGMKLSGVVAAIFLLPSLLPYYPLEEDFL